MARQRPYTTNNAYRALARIEEKAQERAEHIGQFIIGHIRANAPYDENRRDDRDGGPHLRDSYYYRVDEATGDVIIKTRRRYWAFVEFGTAEHGSAQPHVRPAIEAARAEFR